MGNAQGTLDYSVGRVYGEYMASIYWNWSIINHHPVTVPQGHTCESVTGES